MFSVKYDLPPKGVSYKQWRKQIKERSIGGSIFIFGIFGLLMSLFFIKTEVYTGKTVNLENLNLADKKKQILIEGTITAEDSIPQKMFGTNIPIIKGSIILKLKQGKEEKILYEENYQAENLFLSSKNKKIRIDILPEDIGIHRKINYQGKIGYSNKNGKIIPIVASYADTTFNIAETNSDEKMQFIIVKEFLNSGEKVIVKGSLQNDIISNPKDGKTEMFFSSDNQITAKESANKSISIFISLIMIVIGFILYRKGTKYRLKLINSSL